MQERTARGRQLAESLASEAGVQEMVREVLKTKGKEQSQERAEIHIGLEWDVMVSVLQAVPPSHLGMCAQVDPRPSLPPTLTSPNAEVLNDAL